MFRNIENPLQHFSAQKIKRKEPERSSIRPSSIHNDNMQLLQTIAFLFGLYALASATTTLPESSHRSMATVEQEKAHVRVRKRALGETPKSPTKSKRMLKASGGSGDGNGNIDKSSSYATCTTFEGVPPGIMNKTRERNQDDECLNKNGCNTGCCRMFNYLQCDKKEEFYLLEVRHVGSTSIVCFDVNTPTKQKILTNIFFFCLL